MPTIALLNPCGHGNLGNAAILDATIHNIRARLPGARICGITLRPDDTAWRHDIESYPIGGVSQIGYAIIADPPRADPDEPPQVDTVSRSGSGALGSLRRMAKAAIKAVLPHRLPFHIREELRHWRLAWRLMGDVDLLVVAGGGQMDEYWGGPWGHPYAMFKWSLLARLRKARVAIISTGMGSLDSPLSRFFVRRVFRLTGYVSYRDRGSKDLVEAIVGRRSSPVVPDLAFGLPVAPAKNRPDGTDPRTPIAVSPMSYLDPRSWPTKDQAAYEDYVDRLAAVVEGLVREGRPVRLIRTETADRRPCEEVLERALARGVDPAEVTEVPTDTVDAYLREAATCEVVVASRLHGVILGYKAGGPVLTLSYNRKVTAVTEDLGQGRWCLDLHDFDPSEAVARILRLAEEARPVRASIAAAIEEMQPPLADQYDRVFQGLGGTG